MKLTKYAPNDLPQPGSVFITPLGDGRFGVVRVLRTKVGSGHAFAFVEPSAWIGSSPTRPSDSQIRIPLKLMHHSWSKQRFAQWVFTPPPASFVYVGGIPVFPEDDQFCEESYGSWEFLPRQILVQWRWDNDRESLLREESERKEKRAKDAILANERRKEMLRSITIDSLVTRTWFDSWDEEDSLQRSRAIVKNLIQKISAEPKLTKTKVRSLLKGAVKEFNVIEEGDFIETIHREEIFEAFDLIMCAAKQPELVEEIDRWRRW